MSPGRTTPKAAKTQMSGRYPRTLADEAHDYALEHGLSLNVLLSVALAEYLAKRRRGDAGPAPQLHYRKGHPPAALVQEQQQLMHVDPRGRKMADRCPRTTWTHPDHGEPPHDRGGERGQRPARRATGTTP